MTYINFLVLVGIVLIGFTLGWLFTETRFRLSKWRLFQFEAFVCRQCLTFHLIWVPSVAYGLWVHSWMTILVGVIFSFIVWAGIKLDIKKRTKKI